MGLLTLSLDSQAKWEDWSDSNKILFKQYVLGSTLDYMQSKRMLKNPQYIEGNPFFGDITEDGSYWWTIFCYGLTK